MKKHLTWFSVAIAVVLLAAWSKPIITNISFQKPVSKSVSFSIFRTASYTSKIYDNASARLDVAIVKVTAKGNCVVWQKSYDARQLSQYPLLQNALSQTVTVNNVDDRKDKLEVIYTLTYSTNGNSMQLQDGTIISKGQKEGKLFINI